MQFGKLLEEVYFKCGFRVLRRVATGGSTTTVQDTGIINKYGENKFAQGANGGHILFISQTTDLAAPQHQYGEVSAYANPITTPTFTIPTLSATAASGDIYSLMKPNIPLYEMIAVCNDGLRGLPALELVDTSLTTLNETLVYNLPFAAGQYEIQELHIGNDTDGWADMRGHYTVPNSGSTANKLIFYAQPVIDSVTPANQTIRIRYLAKHPTLSIYSDYVEKSVPDNVAIAVCAEAALESIMRKRPSWFNDKTRMGMWGEIKEAARQAKMENPIRLKPATRQRRIGLGELP